MVTARWLGNYYDLGSTSSFCGYEMTVELERPPGEVAVSQWN